MSALVDHKFGYTTMRCMAGGRLDQLCAELKQEFPKLRMQEKRRHWYWRVLRYLILVLTFGGNRRFLGGFTTTIRQTIAWSDEKWEKIDRRLDSNWEDRVWSTLMHEREHLRQFKRYTTIGMSLLYLLVFFPVGLSWFRARFEREGYLQTLRCWYALDPSWARHPKAKRWWVDQFTGPNYAWCWIFRGQVEGWYDRELFMLEAAA